MMNTIHLNQGIMRSFARSNRDEVGTTNTNKLFDDSKLKKIETGYVFGGQKN